VGVLIKLYVRSKKLVTVIPNPILGDTDCLGVPGKSYVCSNQKKLSQIQLRGMVGLGVPINPYVAQTQSWGAENNLGYTIRLGVPIESYVLENCCRPV